MGKKNGDLRQLMDKEKEPNGRKNKVDIRKSRKYCVCV